MIYIQFRSKALIWLLGLLRLLSHNLLHDFLLLNQKCSHNSVKKRIDEGEDVETSEMFSDSLGKCTPVCGHIYPIWLHVTRCVRKSAKNKHFSEKMVVIVFEPLSDAWMATRAAVSARYSLLPFLGILESLRVHVLYLQKTNEVYWVTLKKTDRKGWKNHKHKVFDIRFIKNVNKKKQCLMNDRSTYSRKSHVAVSAENTLAHLRNVLNGISSTCEM